MALHRASAVIRTRIPQTPEHEHSSPLFLTSSFTFDDAESMRATFADEREANIYSRFTNPNVDEFVNRMCILERTEAGFATASGMAAVFASFLAFLKTGDHLISSSAVFGSTHSVITKILPNYGIECTYVRADDPASWEAAVRPNTRMFYLETPTNPGLDLVDLEAASKLCRAHGLLLNVDNCFATPYGQQPAAFGADLVIHSATKWADGQGRVLGGVVLGKEEYIFPVANFCRSTGPALSPFNAWVLSRSLETLEVRMERHTANAAWLAEQLQNHPKIGWLKYPLLPSHPQYALAKKQMTNGGGLFCFELKGGVESGRKFLDGLKMLSVTGNLGDTRSIASHPASTTHAKLSEKEREAVNITPGLIRISAGLENREDILQDILQTLERS